MSLKLEMLQAARMAPRLLGESTDLIRGFVRRQQNPAGGFNDRSGRNDLYYTVFGLDCLVALQEPVEEDALERFLKLSGTGAELDLVHLSCLARCWAVLPSRFPSDLRAALLENLEKFTPETVYQCFLLCGAWTDLQEPIQNPTAILACLESMRSADGAYGNAAGLPLGSTNATAAAATLLRHLGRTIPAQVSPWLIARCDPAGGFRAMPNAPIPDLLSTATALHALAGMQVPLEKIKEPCLDFIDSLWTNEGGFHGHWTDDHLDVEYTSYGLLALGHLA